jgi:hypothetical protein
MGYMQAPDQVVDVRALFPDDTFPRGSRPKQWYLVADPLHPFLLGGHRYLFKESIARSPVQYWSEIIAYHLGKLCGVTVPPTFVAVDGGRMVPGALSEYFLQYPGKDPTEQFTHAIDHLVALQPDFDTKKGLHHNLESNLRLLSLFERFRQLVGGIDYFARTLVFDALIGNTDRHQENWGFIWSDYNARRSVRLAPAYDNGTSLGYEHVDQVLPGFTGARLDAYIKRGTHHMRIREGDQKKPAHVALCEEFGRRHPYRIPMMLNVLRFDLAAFGERLFHLTKFEVPTRFSHQRAEFVLRLTTRRRELLVDALSGLGMQ